MLQIRMCSRLAALYHSLASAPLRVARARVCAPPSHCGTCLRFFIARRVRPSLSLVDVEVEFCARSCMCPTSVFFMGSLRHFAPYQYLLYNFRHFILLLSMFPPFLLLLPCFCFLCSRWSFEHVSRIFPCPADHVPNWKPRSVNVKNTHTHTHTHASGIEWLG